MGLTQVTDECEVKLSAFEGKQWPRQEQCNDSKVEAKLDSVCFKSTMSPDKPSSGSQEDVGHLIGDCEHDCRWTPAGFLQVSVPGESKQRV